jgi:hypothetical protein
MAVAGHAWQFTAVLDIGELLTARSKWTVVWTVPLVGITLAGQRTSEIIAE